MRLRTRVVEGNKNSGELKLERESGEGGTIEWESSKEFPIPPRAASALDREQKFSAQESGTVVTLTLFELPQYVSLFDTHLLKIGSPI